MIRETGKFPSSTARDFTQVRMSEGTEMLVFTNAFCTALLLLPSSNGWQQKVEKNFKRGVHPMQKKLDTPMNTSSAGEKIFLAIGSKRCYR